MLGGGNIFQAGECGNPRWGGTFVDGACLSTVPGVAAMGSFFRAQTSWSGCLPVWQCTQTSGSQPWTLAVRGCSQVSHHPPLPG
jgi:hypothetical protein